MKAPLFSLPDQTGKVINLSDYFQKWVVVYFYPKDDTPGCTVEACGFRDSMSELIKHDIVVLGISKDSVESHKKFAQKYSLQFSLLSDISKETIRAYGAWGEKKFMGKIFDGIIRKTFIVDPEGNIAKEYPNVVVFGHAQDVLKEIQSLQP